MNKSRFYTHYNDWGIFNIQNKYFHIKPGICFTLNKDAYTGEEKLSFVGLVSEVKQIKVKVKR
jgi:hypothetical protein